MPTDDIVARKIDAISVVAIGGRAERFGPTAIAPVLNRAEEQFVALGLRELLHETGPYMAFYEGEPERDLMAYLALPVSQAPSELPEPAELKELPAIEAAVAVRGGRAAQVFPMVYDDLAQWIDEHGFEPEWPGREVWVRTATSMADADQQIFECQLAFRRPEG
jgi:hypothetical protein